MAVAGLVLVTAFEPFGGEKVNASWEAARRIDGVRCGEALVSALRLPCAYGASVDALFAAVERLGPSAVLMTGQAARRSIVCVERLARNRANASARDNLGAIGSAARDGPDVIATPVPARRVAQAIRAAGVAARVSGDAGDYVCNHLYYHALRRLRAGAPAIFIHLPATPEQAVSGGRPLASADAARALLAAAALLAAGQPAAQGRQTATLNDFAS